MERTQLFDLMGELKLYGMTNVMRATSTTAQKWLFSFLQSTTTDCILIDYIKKRGDLYCKAASQSPSSCARDALVAPSFLPAPRRIRAASRIRSRYCYSHHYCLRPNCRWRPWFFLFEPCGPPW